MIGEPIKTTEKPWGASTRMLFLDGQLFQPATIEGIQVERIAIEQGGYSSVHYHLHKANQFIVSQGTLEVRTFYDDMTANDVMHIHPGGYYVVSPRIRHQFYAITHVVGYEIYWPLTQPLDPDDIERFTSNGVDELSNERRIECSVQYCYECNQPKAGSDMRQVVLDGAIRDVCSACNPERTQ